MEVSKVLTAAEVAEIRARADKATPGPWIYNTFNHLQDTQRRDLMMIPDHPNDGEFEPNQIAERSAWYKESERNIVFVEHARSDIPALCDSHDALERENKRLKHACYAISDEVEQELGKALGYPAYRDDPKNFPDHDKEDDSVCVGDHVPQTLAYEARMRIADLTAKLAEYAKIIKVRWKEYGYKDEFFPADPLVAFDELLQLVTGENDGARQQTMEAEAKLAERDKALAAAREALTSKNDRGCGAHLPDMEVAGMVRMLMRGDLDHEMVCVSARDRIRHLSGCVANALAALPSAPAPEVLKKGGLCPGCHCSQTLPADLQQCRCACHQIDRAVPPPTPQEQSADLIRQVFDVLIDRAPGGGK